MKYAFHILGVGYTGSSKFAPDHWYQEKTQN